MMRTGGVCLLLALWIAGSAPAAFGQAKKPPAPKPKPAAKKAPTAPRLKILEDGSIETDKAIIRYWQVNHKAPAALAIECMTYQEFLGKDVVFDDKTRGQNILRVQAPPEKWPLVSRLLDLLDVPEPQVFVEARIIEIKYDSNLEFGVEAIYDRRAATDAAQPFFGKFVGNFNPESYLESLGTGVPWGGGAFEFNTANKRWVAEHGEFSYIFRALQERGSAEILSKPSIIATQGKKATIITGTKFPVQTVALRGNQPTVSTTFENTGIKLEIEPMLIGRSSVTLSIVAEDSQVTEVIPGPEGSLQPVISNRRAETQVSVRDGETIIIGGLLTTSTIESKSGLPFLQDIPLLGYLFSATKTKEVKGELVFFIQPQIIKRSVDQELIVPPSERRRVGEDLIEE
ncbi:MAG: type II and III secretion system protein [Planctomycetota bacterium]